VTAEITNVNHSQGSHRNKQMTVMYEQISTFNTGLIITRGSRVYVPLFAAYCYI